jgi:hypothetical protein
VCGVRDVELAIPLPVAVLESSARAAPEWLTLEEAATRLRLTVPAARKRAQRGTLPGALRDPAGSRWLVDARALEPPSAATVRDRSRGPRDRRGGSTSR